MNVFNPAQTAAAHAFAEDKYTIFVFGTAIADPTGPAHALSRPLQILIDQARAYGSASFSTSYYGIASFIYAELEILLAEQLLNKTAGLAFFDPKGETIDANNVPAEIPELPSINLKLAA